MTDRFFPTASCLLPEAGLFYHGEKILSIPAGNRKFTGFPQRMVIPHFSMGWNCDKMYQKNYAQIEDEIFFSCHCEGQRPVAILGKFRHGTNCFEIATSVASLLPRNDKVRTAVQTFNFVIAKPRRGCGNLREVPTWNQLPLDCHVSRFAPSSQ